MKKFLIILLTLTCTLMLFACGDDGVTVKDFKQAITATNPTEIEISIKHETANGDLNSSMVTTFAADGSFTIVGSYEQFCNASASEDKISVPINISCDASGNYSDGGDFAGTNPASTGAKLNLGAKKIDTSISSDGKVLTANVAAAQTKAVFGVEYAYDVTLVVSIDDGKVTSYTMNYTDAFGAVTVVCSYK
ncbi:MAG: hypothetical protein J6V09_07135 [Clostridia bacterium]|nr:hypothetical protein [Clostridia bacterium]